MREKKEQWLQLCEQAAVEQDPERLLKLIDEISRMLDEKNRRLQQSSPPSRTGGGHSAAGLG
jgi:hypothetical protein